MQGNVDTKKKTCLQLKSSLLSSWLGVKVFPIELHDLLDFRVPWVNQPQNALMILNKKSLIDLSSVRISPEDSNLKKNTLNWPEIYLKWLQKTIIEVTQPQIFKSWDK